MVLGLLLGLAVPIAAGVPTTIGVAESVSYQQKANESVKDDEKRMVKFAVEVYCEGGEEVMSTATGQGEGKGKGRGDEKGKGKGRGRGEREVHGRRLGLRDGKVGLFLVGAFFFLGGQLVDWGWWGWWDGGDGGSANGGFEEGGAREAERQAQREGQAEHCSNGVAFPSSPPSRSPTTVPVLVLTTNANPPPSGPKVYVSTPTAAPAHPMTAFYIAYPDPDRPPTRGLVSTISDDPPLLNWIYVDKDTRELRYGNRTQSREHVVGPWDWTRDEDEDADDEGEGEGEGLVFEGWEGFVLVEEEEGVWGVRFDRGDDGLKGVVGVKGKRVLRVSLERKVVEGG